MIRFFTQDIQGETAYFDQEEARHISKAIRKSKGDTLYFTDGKGHLYQGRIQEESRKGIQVQIIETITYAPRNPKLHIAIAPTKNTSRLEWFCEKVCEIGVHEITPILCDHSERTNLRTDRLEKIMISAVKQCLNVHLPILNEPISLRDFLGQEQDVQKYFGYVEKGTPPLLQDLCQAQKDTTILIGPEGDFSEKEVDLFKEKEWEMISLGPSRLRTETAGIVACSWFWSINR